MVPMEVRIIAFSRGISTCYSQWRRLRSPWAEYLSTRQQQLGCKRLHGPPGDFDLLALDFVEKAGLRWVGNCNELNAGYAADAYARITGLGAIITTFGVGELSAFSAVAGGYAEQVPLVHFVGIPPREAQEAHMFLHHTLDNGDSRSTQGSTRRSPSLKPISLTRTQPHLGLTVSCKSVSSTFDQYTFSFLPIW